MNKVKLLEAEHKFFMIYPGGFNDPRSLEIAKKHKVEKMTKMTQESFAPERFSDTTEIIESMSKIACASSLVSVFEKPKFRDLLKELNSTEKSQLAEGLHEFLHGEQARGFDLMADLLGEYKLAKWPLLTIFGVYFNPSVEVFVKPTTAKGIIEHFELQDIKYSPKPSYEFYESYRKNIHAMKELARPELRVDNAAFCGFLMVAMGVNVD